MSIIGTDGRVPVIDTDSLWKEWAYQQIYLGQEAEGKYVPKVNDYVRDYEDNSQYKVIEVDATTLIPKLKRIRQIPEGSLDETDILLGVPHGSVRDTYRIYLDKNVMPYALAVDQRCKIYSTESKYCIIYRGSQESANLRPISTVYDSSGNLLGNKVPLSLIVMPNDQNIAVKGVPTCYCVEDMPNGEVVLAIFYSDEGHVVSKQSLIVENTGFLRPVMDSVKYVTEVSLRSPYIQGNSQLIEIPLNTLNIGINFIGVVHYSDGSKREFAVDGTKFAVFGLDHYASTIIGQELEVVATYYLEPNEKVYGSSVGPSFHISKKYKVRTVQPDGQHTVRLHYYPEWVDALNGYRMKFFMYNLERSISYDVTAAVRYNSNAPEFDPTLYGVRQKPSVTINLQDVSGTFGSYLHVQPLEIILRNQATEPPTNWEVADPGQDGVYGTDLVCKFEFVNQNLKKLRIDSGSTTLADWLERVYRKANPLVDLETEPKAPEPDFFRLVFRDGTEVELPISRWNTEIAVGNHIANTDTLFIKFVRKAPNNVMQLGIGAMPVHQV